MRYFRVRSLLILTRPPLKIKILRLQNPVRLACLRHAASVHPEPGSNSQKRIDVNCSCLTKNCSHQKITYHHSIVKGLFRSMPKKGYVSTRPGLHPSSEKRKYCRSRCSLNVKNTILRKKAPPLRGFFGKNLNDDALSHSLFPYYMLPFGTRQGREYQNLRG